VKQKTKYDNLSASFFLSNIKIKNKNNEETKIIKKLKISPFHIFDKTYQWSEKKNIRDSQRVEKID